MIIDDLEVGDYIRDDSLSPWFNGEIGLVIRKSKTELTIKWILVNNKARHHETMIYYLYRTEPYTKISKKEAILEVL